LIFLGKSNLVLAFSRFIDYISYMKKLLFFIILGTCIGGFNLQAQMQKYFSFGLTGNIMRQDIDTSDGLLFSNENQSRSMFLLGFYCGQSYFWENFPIGLFGDMSMQYTEEMTCIWKKN
jgi:hypothetical protein